MPYQIQQKVPPPRSPQVDIRAKRGAYQFKTMRRYVPRQFRMATSRKQYKAEMWRPFQSQSERAANELNAQFEHSTAMRIGGKELETQSYNWRKYGSTFKPFDQVPDRKTVVQQPFRPWWA